MQIIHGLYNNLLNSLIARDMPGMSDIDSSLYTFAKYLSFGLTFSLAFQTILNLMVVVGLIPVTGVTLPFLSYGGSSLLISLTNIGILLNISKHK